jgi:hypothetical protein
MGYTGGSCLAYVLFASARRERAGFFVGFAFGTSRHRLKERKKRAAAPLDRRALLLWVHTPTTARKNRR